MKTLHLLIVMLLSAPLFPSQVQAQGDQLTSYEFLIPDIEKQVGSGPVPGQQSTLVSIAPNIQALFPEIQAQGFPTTIDLSVYDVSMQGATWNDLLSEWERRQQAQTTQLQTNLPALQLTGFNNTSWLFGQLPTQHVTDGFDLFSASSPFLLGGLAQAATPATSSFPGYGSTSTVLQTNGIYPWMSSYWTATSTPSWETPSEPSLVTLP